MNVPAVIHFHGKFDVNLGRLMEINKKSLQLPEDFLCAVH